MFHCLAWAAQQLQYSPTVCGSGTSQIQVNPTQVSEEMGHPVHRFSIAAGRMNTSVDEHLVPLDVLRGPFAKL